MGGSDQKTKHLSLNIAEARSSAAAKHQSYSTGLSKSATADSPATPSVPQKVPLQKVLDDQLPSPLSYQDFYDFLCREHSEENLEFYMAVKEYAHLASMFPTERLAPSTNGGGGGSSPLSAEPATPDSGPRPSEQELLSELRTSMQSILGTFFATGAEKELNVPSKISKQLLAVAGDGGAGDLRPAVFDAAVENVCTMLRLSSFPSFCKSVGSSPMPAAPISPVSIDGMFGAPSTVSLVRRISTASSISRRKNSASGVFLLRQVLADELPSPYSFKEFYEFLRKEHSEENADFYLKAKKYSEVAKKVPEKFLLPRPAGEQVDAATPAAQPSGDAIGEEAPPPELAELVELMDAIVQAHFTDDSEQELNITHKLRAAFLHSVRDERDLRPAVLDPILDHVTVVMEYSSFPNFRKSVARAEAGVIAASTAVGNKAAGVPSTPTSAGPVAPPAAGRPGALSGLTVAFEESRRGSGDTPSVGEVTPTPSLGLTDQPQATATRKQITIQQILEDQLDSPYTYKEFYDFLCNEHSEENVEFYNTYQSYKVLAAGLPAAVLRPQSAFDALPDGCDRALARSLRSMLERVLRDFFTQGAEFELNVPAKVVRRLLEDVAPLDDQPDDVELEDVVRRCYDPCVFDGAVEAVLTMMRLSSLPSFLKYAKTAKPPSASE